MKPSRCTLRLNIFISTFVHGSGIYVPIIRRTYCIYTTLVFFTLYGWLSGLLVLIRLVRLGGGGSNSTSTQPNHSYPNQQTRQPPIQSEKYQCHVDTVRSHDEGHIVARTMQRIRNKYSKKQCAPSWLHLKNDYAGMHGQQNIKFTKKFSSSKKSFLHSYLQITHQICYQC